MKLTAREKKLLYILLCIIILTGGMYFLVLPTMERHTDAKLANQSAQTAYASVKATEVTMTDIEERLKETQANLKTVVDGYYGLMNKEDVDNLITNMAIAHRLTPTALGLENMTFEKMISYQDYIKQKEKEENGEVVEAQPDKFDDNTMLYLYKTSFRVEGSISNVQAFVDEVNITKSIRIDSVSYDISNTENQIVITFKIYMI